MFELGSESFPATLEDFEILTEDIPGWQVASDNGLTVALDVTLTPELEAEGMARELVNRIQNIRKTRNFNVTDQIAVTLENHPEVASAVESFGGYIRRETLSATLSLADNVTEGEVLELPNEAQLRIRVELV